jgi:hypothetical protein
MRLIDDSSECNFLDNRCALMSTLTTKLTRANNARERRLPNTGLPLARLVVHRQSLRIAGFQGGLRALTTAMGQRVVAGGERWRSRECGSRTRARRVLKKSKVKGRETRRPRRMGFGPKGSDASRVFDLPTIARTSSLDSSSLRGRAAVDHSLYLVGARTGTLAGFSPLRMRSM